MDRVTLLMLGIIATAPCACSASTGAEPVAISQSPQLRNWQQFVAEASRRFRVPQAWIYAVMDAESGGNTMRDGRPITSRAGAIGLMQLMPATYAEMRVAHGLGPNPHDPRDNILAGTAYLRAMYDRFGFPGLFAAYNAGPERYEGHLKHAKPLPKETVDYLEQLRAAGVSATDMKQF
ncbi:MAG: lytic transglycosylase domain-containing protein, partial [Mesorhizobium sp.]